MKPYPLHDNVLVKLGETDEASDLWLGKVISFGPDAKTDLTNAIIAFDIEHASSLVIDEVEFLLIPEQYICAILK